MYEDKVYTCKEMREEEIYTDEYVFIREEGTYEGVLQLKAGYGKGLRCFFILKDGRKVLAPMPWFRNKGHKLEKIPLGTKMGLRYERVSSGAVLVTKMWPITEIGAGEQ